MYCNDSLYLEGRKIDSMHNLFLYLNERGYKVYPKFRLSTNFVKEYTKKLCIDVNSDSELKSKYKKFARSFHGTVKTKSINFKPSIVCSDKLSFKIKDDYNKKPKKALLFGFK